MCISMPLEVGSSVNAIAETFLKSDTLHNMVKNPIYTAILITLIVFMTVLFVYRDVDSDESQSTLALRSSFWVFLGTLGVMMLHNKVFESEQRNDKNSSAYTEVFNGAFDNFQPVVKPDSMDYTRF